MNRHIDSFSSQLNGVIPEFYSTQGWNLFLRRNLNVWEVEILCLLFQLLSNIILGYNKIDSIIWKGHPQVSLQSEVATVCWKWFLGLGERSGLARLLWRSLASLGLWLGKLVLLIPTSKRGNFSLAVGAHSVKNTLKMLATSSCILESITSQLWCMF